MALFGDVVAVTAGMVPACLHAQVHQGLVPLLLHLHDHSPAVASVSALGCRLQNWEQGLGCMRRQGVGAPVLPDTRAPEAS